MDLPVYEIDLTNYEVRLMFHSMVKCSCTVKKQVTENKR